MPQRLPVLWAKAVLYAGVTFVLMLAAGLVAFLGGQQLLGTHGTSLSADGALRAIVGVAGYLALIGVFSVALGFIIRSTAGGIATLFALLLVLPISGLLLPAGWREHTLPYLPSNAGATMFTRTPPPTPCRPRPACWCSWAGSRRHWPAQLWSSSDATPDRRLVSQGQGISALMRVPRSGGLSR